MDGRQGEGRRRAWMSWSSGKDSTLALHEARGMVDLEVVGLLTTLNAEVERVAIHGVRRSVLEAQAEALGLPLEIVELPSPCPNAVYQERMDLALDRGQATGVEALIFGDLFLEDVRRYRELMLERRPIAPVFPLWQRPTAEVARTILELGIKAIVTCVDLAQAPGELAGRWFDEELLAELPTGVDPCGENGEFHTVVVDGPGFPAPIDVLVGETVTRDGFVFADVYRRDDDRPRRRA